MEESWSQFPDKLIIDGCLDGDEKAWQALVDRYKRLVYFFEDPRPSYQAIAIRLGLSENSIGFTRGRCLNNLKKILDELGYPS